MHVVVVVVLEAQGGSCDHVSETGAAAVAEAAVLVPVLLGLLQQFTVKITCMTWRSFVFSNVLVLHGEVIKQSSCKQGLN